MQQCLLATLSCQQVLALVLHLSQALWPRTAVHTTCMWQSWLQTVCVWQSMVQRAWQVGTVCTGNLPPSCAVSSVCRSLRSSTLTSNTSLNHPGPPKFNILAPLPYSLHLIQPSEHPHNHPQAVLASSRLRSTSVCGSSIASDVCDGVILNLFGLFETTKLT